MSSLPHPRIIALSRLGAALLLAGSARTASAQSLRGSPASVERMYAYARSHTLPFYEDAPGLRGATRRGALVPLPGNADYRLRGVAYPFVQPATRRFVERLGAQYRAACGAPLVVTSAIRPEDEQPPNSSSESVHPTGIAVDLHKPAGPCRSWLRRTLLALEGAGVIEATEEFHPPHFHVAVFGDDYLRYTRRVARVATQAQVKRVASVNSAESAKNVESVKRGLR